MPAARKKTSRAASRNPRDRTLGKDLSRELALAKKAALRAGEILRGYWNEKGYEVSSKGRDNPVTTADLEADRALKEMLHGAYPEYGWLSEETADDARRLKMTRVWIVDPLDGTKEFIKGIPEFTIAIALAEEGLPVLGVTYNPIKREMFWGARGHGTHLGSRRVRVSRTRVLHRARVLASRSEVARGEWQVFDGQLVVSPTGSVAYKLALVAAGKGDATFTRSPKSEWDIASGVALILEAGGKVADIHGNQVRFNQPSVRVPGFIASNSALYPALLKVAPKTLEAGAGRSAEHAKP